MPSKHRIKKKADRDYYTANVENKKNNAQKYYQQNRSDVKCRSSIRKTTDKTGKQKDAARNRQKFKKISTNTRQTW